MFSLILTCQESYRISGRRIDKNYNFYNEIQHHLRRYVKSMHPKTCYLVIEYILPYKTFGCCISWLVHLLYTLYKFLFLLQYVHPKINVYHKTHERKEV